MPKHRLDKISEEIKREISEIMRTELKDPRVAAICSITDVLTTPDLKFAKVFVSVLGDEQQQKDTMKGLVSAAGFIRKKVSEKINLRYMPEIHFELDKSIEHGAHILKLINDVNKKDGGENA